MAFILHRVCTCVLTIRPVRHMYNLFHAFHLFRVSAISRAPPGTTPLHLVVLMHSHAALSAAHLAAFAACARRLIEAGADFSLVNEHNQVKPSMRP